MTTSPVVLFDYQDHYVRTITDELGNPWFVAKDVCAALELSDVSRACQNHPNDEKLIRTLFVSGQNRDVLCLTESGLYRLIFRSNKPEAENFRLWVFREVLPAIRKTGTYTRQNVPVPIAAESDWPLALAQTREGERMVRELVTGLKIAKLVGRKNRRRMLEQANDIVIRRTGIDCLAYFGIDLDMHFLPEHSTEEVVSRFLADRCVEDEDSRIPASALYAAFREWYAENLEDGIPPSGQIFFRDISSRYTKIKSSTIWYCGLRLTEKEVAL